MLHQALAAQKGLVLIVPHFGTWEIMNSYVAQFTEMTIMYKPVKDPGADLFVREARSREGAQLVPTDESGVRQIFKALKQGGTTVILPDHTPKQGGEMIPYFGFPLASSNLSAKLIQKTKAKALLLYAIRKVQPMMAPSSFTKLLRTWSTVILSIIIGPISALKPTLNFEHCITFPLMRL